MVCTLKFHQWTSPELSSENWYQFRQFQRKSCFIQWLRLKFQLITASNRILPFSDIIRQSRAAQQSLLFILQHEKYRNTINVFCSISFHKPEKFFNSFLSSFGWVKKCRKLNLFENRWNVESHSFRFAMMIQNMCRFFQTHDFFYFSILPHNCDEMKPILTTLKEELFGNFCFKFLKFFEHTFLSNQFLMFNGMKKGKFVSFSGFFSNWHNRNKFLFLSATGKSLKHSSDEGGLRLYSAARVQICLCFILFFSLWISPLSVEKLYNK